MRPVFNIFSPSVKFSLLCSPLAKDKHSYLRLMDSLTGYYFLSWVLLQLNIWPQQNHLYPNNTLPACITLQLLIFLSFSLSNSECIWENAYFHSYFYVPCMFLNDMVPSTVVFVKGCTLCSCGCLCCSMFMYIWLPIITCCTCEGTETMLLIFFIHGVTFHSCPRCLLLYCFIFVFLFF